MSLGAVRLWPKGPLDTGGYCPREEIKAVSAFLIKPGILKWIRPTSATFIYTVICRPFLFKKIVGFLIKKIIPEEIAIHQTILSLNKNDPILSGSLFLGCYETAIIEFFLSKLKKDTIFIDVGANIGLYSALACKVVSKKNPVIAIEPDKKNVELIERTRMRNDYKNLCIEKLAAGEYACTRKLFLNPMNPADHRLYDKTHSRISNSILVDSIDNIVRRYGLARVDLVKIDTQGYEAKVWGGMYETLKKNHNIQIIMEFWPWGLNESGSCPKRLLDSIRALGFCIYELSDEQKPLVQNSNEYLLSFKKERQHLNLFLART